MDRSHGRPHLRLPHFDYTTNSTYFLTICTHHRSCLFGFIRDGQMFLNGLGEIVRSEWHKSATIRPEIRLWEFVVMPNHLHGIVEFERKDNDANGRLHLQEYHSPRHPHSLSSFVAGFKATTTRVINTFRGTPGAQVWQANYYEHVIRSEKALLAIAEYIANNPLKWELDRDNPANISDSIT